MINMIATKATNGSGARGDEIESPSPSTTPKSTSSLHRQRFPDAKRYVETPEYTESLKRQIDGLGQRIAKGDIACLPHLVGLIDYVTELTKEVVTDLREQHGYSWFEVGRELGVSKQAAQQRWGKVS